MRRVMTLASTVTGTQLAAAVITAENAMPKLLRAVDTSGKKRARRMAGLTTNPAEMTGGVDLRPKALRVASWSAGRP